MNKSICKLLLLLFFLPKLSLADDIQLPKTVAWTAYDVGSTGYSEAVAMGAELKNNLNVNLRLLPGKNDVSRLLPLVKGKVQFSSTGIGGAYLAQEGVFEYAESQWGPQSLRLVMSNNSGLINLAVGVSESSGIKSYADLKGKRVAYIEGAPSLNISTEAFLAYGGLTWDDVKVVKFGGHASGWKGLIAGDVDATFSATNSGFAYEAASGPHGLYWPSIDPENTEGMKRMLSVVPYFYPNVATIGANIDKNVGLKGVTYGYPVLITVDKTDVDLVYNMIKALDEYFPNYGDKLLNIGGWALEKQKLTGNQLPYHEGAVKYWKEKGLWTEEAQKYNERLIERQNILQKTWQSLPEKSPDIWLDKRKESLSKAGFDVTFK